jgi:hypothetical protein
VPRWVNATGDACGDRDSHREWVRNRSGNRGRRTAGAPAIGVGDVTLGISGSMCGSAVKPLCGTGPTPVEDGPCALDRGFQAARRNKVLR